MTKESHVVACPRCGSGDVYHEQRDAPPGSDDRAFGAWSVCGACGHEWPKPTAVRQEVIWMDADGKPVDRADAERCEVTTYAADGTVLGRTYAAVPPEPIVWLPGGDPERFVGDGGEIEWDDDDTV